MATGDPFNLERFVAAQDAGGTYDRAAATSVSRQQSSSRNGLETQRER